ncbi:TRAM domain-containing protein [Candidatus Woesearchaeota archaeon]|nr:TRAM domain-containing protein [Candidatus Woesearchaeota archaeon]
MGYDDERQGSFGPIPVKVGDVLEVTIEAVGAKGDGIAKKDGFVLFVPGVKEGERIKIRVTKVLRKVGFAEKVGSEESSSSDEGDTGSSDEEATEGEPEQEEDSEDFGDEN